MSSWQPSPEGIAELVNVLRDSTSEDSSVQAQVTKRLESFEAIPDYAGYLVYILTQVTNEDERFRAVAGLILKNVVRSIGTTTTCPPEALAFVKQSVLSSLGDANSMVRSTVGTVIVSLLTAQGVENWTEAVGALIAGMESTNELEQEGAFSTLSKVCEDLPKQLDVEVNGQRLLDFMIPKFIAFTDHPNARYRSQAISCLNSFISTGPPSFAANIDGFFAALFRRASDESSDVRKAVCQALTLLLTARPDKVVPELTNVAEFMIYSTQDKDEAVALEACEFWLGFAEAEELTEHLRPWIGKVAPVLLNGMVYTEEDLIWLDGDDEDAAVPDRAEDIKPKFYGSKGHGFEHEAAEGASGGGVKKSLAAGDDVDEDEDDDDDDDYDDDEEDEFASEWNLRKCSAAALDVMSVTFETELLDILLPHLKEKLFSTEWVQRECGILALGAMAEGCLEGIVPHLPSLIPFLINTLSDPKPLVRAITCWTIGRYSSWCVSASTPDAQTQYFLPAMEGLLRMVLDNNKRVQEAGCSAFATLEEEAGTLLLPFLEPIIRNLVFAFSKYQQKNLLILYDAIGTLADSVGEGLNNPALIEILMPPLIEKWNRLTDSDEDIIPLLECLSSVTIAASESFAKYAVPVYERCLKMVQACLADYWAWTSNPAQLDEPDKTFLIVSLDLLSGLTQGLKANMSDLIVPAGTPAESLPPLIQLLEACLNHPEASVRQSAYALLGDMAISCPALNHYLALYLPRIVKEISDQVAAPKYEEVSVCNNAAWAVGEMAMQCQPTPTNPNPALKVPLGQHVAQLVEALIRILINTTTPKSLLENAAVTIGRLGLVYPDVVAVHLETFGKTWCTVLWDIKDNEEKGSAFQGFCQLVMLNPQGMLPDLVYFCNAICKWTTPSAELNEIFRKVLTSFKEMLGPTWDQNFPSFPAVLQERLRSRYNL